MAASIGLLRTWRQGLSPGLHARTAFWERTRKKPAEPVEVSAQVQEPSLVCPPLRSRKYFPPKDLEGRLESRVREIFGPSLPADWQEASLEDKQLKYHLLSQLAAELGHMIPNSQLFQMCRVKDVLTFYSTAVKDVSKFDELSTVELPSNLKIRWEY
uniref:Large ribosomal subunit protein mL50 n=1 Tax=Sphenodon punctatus TaxID=8508 RepID=A0A8D0GWU2_SPHPU